MFARRIYVLSLVATCSIGSMDIGIPENSSDRYRATQAARRQAIASSPPQLRWSALAGLLAQQKVRFQRDSRPMRCRARGRHPPASLPPTGTRATRAQDAASAGASDGDALRGGVALDSHGLRLDLVDDCGTGIWPRATKMVVTARLGMTFRIFVCKRSPVRQFHIVKPLKTAHSLLIIFCTSSTT